MTERHRLVKASSSDMSRKYLKWILVTGFIAGGMIASVLISLFIGEKSFGFLDVIDIIGGTGDATGRDIFLVHRLPRMILAFAAGGALSLAGVILQGIYRNPLVSPYTLGVSGGAAVGVTVVMVLGLHHFAGSMILPVAGFAGAVAAISVIYVLSFHGGKTHIPSMLLTGVMVSFVASSSTMFLKSVASREGLHGIVFWMMGSLEESNMSLVYTALWTALAALLTSHLFTGPLNALRLGQVKAGHLGINTEVTIRILFVLASLLVGIVVSITGVIGFVGLVVPHFVRMVAGTDYRVLLLNSFLGGGIFLVLSDIVARIANLPIGVITGIVGGTVFIIVLAGRNLRTL